MRDTSIQWLMLLNQLPTKQDSLRVRVWRRLQTVGSVNVRNACWCLPDTAQAQEDFQWCVQEIIAAGGEAMICRSSLVDGMTNDQVLALFRTARDADYTTLVAEARAVADAVSADDREALGRQASKLRRSLDAIVAIDHGQAGGRAAAEQAVAKVEQAAAQRATTGDSLVNLPKLSACRGKTWVTRADVGIDRVASAWFIRRYVDPKARFRFVSAASAPRRAADMRFDMFEAEFTHQGNRCTFEVLLAWSGLKDVGLKHLAAIIHDLDLKDDLHQRSETSGVACAVAGVCARHARDQDRIEAACEFFDLLHAGLAVGAPKGKAP